MRLHRTRSNNEPAAVQRGLLLPIGSHTKHTDCAGEVPRWLLLPQRNLRTCALRLRTQVPGGVVQPDQVPAALLLPGHAKRQHDAVPDRTQLRRGGHVRADGVRTGDVRVVRWEEVVRPVPGGALLPHGDVDVALSAGLLLSHRSVDADAVPCESVLRARIAQAQGVPSREDVGERGQVTPRVRAGLSGQGWLRNTDHKPHIHLTTRRHLLGACVGSVSLLINSISESAQRRV